MPEYCPDREGYNASNVCNYTNVFTSQEFQLNSGGPNALEVETLIKDYSTRGWNLSFLKNAASSLSASSWAVVGAAGVAAVAVVL